MTSPEPAGPSDRNPWSNSEKILFYGFLMLVVVKATSYWVGAWHLHPDESWATLAMYRGKDMQSFPIMSNLAHLGFGEPSLFESHNQGLLSERYVPWALHAALFRLFGGMGFFVADLILTPLRFALMFLLLRRSGVGRALAIAVSAVLTCSVTGDFGQLTGAVPGIPILFWGLRIPRPYVSELFLLGTLVPALIIGRGIREDARTGVWPWLICGTSAGLLLQSDFYAGTGLGIGLFGILALAAWRVNGERRVRLVRGSVIAAVSCAVILLPMVIQTLHLNPEGPVRLGLFTVPRTHPFFIPDIRWHATILALLGAEWWSTRHGPRALSTPERAAGRLVLLAITVGALFAMPITNIVLGQGIELYHYRDTFSRFLSLALLVYVVQFGQALWDTLVASNKTGWIGRRGYRSLHVALIGAAILACLFYTWRFALVLPRRSDHLRSEFAEWDSLSDYRRNFVELTRELSRDAYDGKLVLGTFDTQVWSWWVTFRGGYSFLADACTSNTSDAELERRLGLLAKTVGMTHAEFAAFIRRRYVDIFWLGCSKYQASKAHTFAPLWDYPEGVPGAIAGSSIFSSFNVALPLTTRQRLAALYDELALPAAERLDLIVLTKDESLAAFAPSPKESSLVFENDVFRVWTRIPGNGRPGPDGNGPAWRTLDGPNAGPLARPRASSR